MHKIWSEAKTVVKEVPMFLVVLVVSVWTVKIVAQGLEKVAPGYGSKFQALFPF